MERLVLERPTWLLEHHALLPRELSGVLKGRRNESLAADTISDLTKDLESDKIAGDFLNVCPGDDFLPHVPILKQLRTCGVGRCIFYLIDAFLGDRSFVVAACGTVSGPRKLAHGVPQDTVLSSILFNLAMAALPGVV